jgi:hypothetical protein
MENIENNQHSEYPHHPDPGLNHGEPPASIPTPASNAFTNPQHHQHQPEPSHDHSSLYPTPPAHHAPGQTWSNDSRDSQESPSEPHHNSPYAQTPQPQTTEKASTAKTAVLQWLTYAMWGWTVLGLSILTWAVIANFSHNLDDTEFLPYGIAAVIVLLPISYVCDLFYSKRESVHKSGSESVIMIIHAVIFALFGIGSLIGAVFSGVSLLTDPTDVGTIVVALFSSLIIAVFYGFTFLRTINPAKPARLRFIFRNAMLAIVAVVIILSFVGPVALLLSSRNDKLIEAELTPLSTAVQTYATKNKKLPSSLSTLDIKGDTKKLVDRKLVTYKPNTQEPSSSTNGNVEYKSGDTGNAITDLLGNTNAKLTLSMVYYYQLCVNYKHETKNLDEYPMDNEDYGTSLDTYSHPAGEVCYKLSTNDY